MTDLLQHIVKFPLSTNQFIVRPFSYKNGYYDEAQMMMKHVRDVVVGKKLTQFTKFKDL